MKMQHTPGPWVASPAIRSGFTIDAKCDPWMIVTTSDEEGRYGSIETEANARLIAAAPDLLEALQALANMAESFPSELHKDHPDVIAARAAIAKATGE
jgi:hypothetical protein